MTIPNFKSVEDWQDYEEIFKNRWDAKKTLLECVRNDLFPDYSWEHLQPKTLEVINDIVQSMLYDTDYDFEKQFPDYKKDEDDIFVPRKSLKEMIAEAVKEATKEIVWSEDAQKYYDKLND